MAINVGDKLPEATFLTTTSEGVEEVTSSALFGSGKSVIFGMPGAFTGTCSGTHLPSIVGALDGMKAKGVETVAVITVNDPFVIEAWAAGMKANRDGLHFLGDAEAAFTEAMGLTFSFPPRGLINRSQRYAAIIEDGVVTALDIDENPGTCDISGGTAVLAKL